jgi:predicted transcriptional regulator YheO
MIDDSYKALFIGIADKDHEAREQLMAPYNEWLDGHEEGSIEKDIKSIATRIQRCKDQMVTMVCIQPLMHSITL